MKKFGVRSDMEGLYGVVSWPEVIPGTATYEGARKWLHEELNALAGGLAEAGPSFLEIYDEHYFGLNVDPALLPTNTAVYRGKPPYRADWPGGLDGSFSGLILQGYHSMTGTRNANLPHTYEPDIAAIHINDTLVGEIGVEATIAGEAGVPFVLYIGDRHGADEALALVPGVETVAVKEGFAMEKARCRSGVDVLREIRAAAKRVAEAKNPPKPLTFGSAVRLRVSLFPGPFREMFRHDYPKLWEGDDTVAFASTSLTAAWADYWAIKDILTAKLKK